MYIYGGISVYSTPMTPQINSLPATIPTTTLQAQQSELNSNNPLEAGSSAKLFSKSRPVASTRYMSALFSGALATRKKLRPNRPVKGGLVALFSPSAVSLAFCIVKWSTVKKGKKEHGCASCQQNFVEAAWVPAFSAQPNSLAHLVKMNIVQGILSAISPLPDGDMADRLNYCYTSTILIICSAFISGWSFVGQPIQCWFPAYYRGWWMEYALDYCYVQNTYFIGFYEYKTDNYFDFAPHVIEIPKNVTERDEKQIGYYQWVPFILALQALCFFLPVVLWRAIYNSVGFRVRAICETCSIRANMDPSDRSKNVEIVARFLASDHQLAETLGGRVKHALQGRIVLFTYLLVKFIYASNALFQFYLVKIMLGTDSLFWGYKVFMDLINGREWPETGNFPRVNLCDFAVRVLGNLHRHTLQCVLMINMFNEKIFVFLWFWFCLAAIVSTGSLLLWIVRSFSERADRQLISTYLAKIDPQALRSVASRSQITRFVRQTIRPDGMFLIRLISKNSGDLVTCELLSTLWKDFLQSERNHQTLYQAEPLGDKKKLLDEE